MKFSKFVTITAFTTSLLTSTVLAANIGVATTTVNVRTEASTTSDVASSLNAGEQFSVTGAIDGFYSINKDNTLLYVTQDFTVMKEADAMVNSDGVYIRTAPSIDAPVASMLSIATPVTVVGQIDSWYKLKDGSNFAYINKDYVTGLFVDNVAVLDAPPVVVAPVTSSKSSDTAKEQVSTASKYYKINADGGLNLRETASPTSNVITLIPDGFVVSGLETVNGFTKVNYNGTLGYVSADYISETDGYSAVTTVSASEVGSQIIEWAKQYIGTPYSYGGTNLSKGVDCSGFVYSVFKKNPYTNLTLNRTAADQYNNGTRVSKSDLKPGDLVVFDTSGANNGVITHSGIYIGDGNFIHASSGQAYSVTISNLNSGYYLGTYVGGTRVLS